MTAKRRLVTITGTIEELGGRKWQRICVADNGPGIPETDLPKIFLPFYTTKSEGTGLGLAVVQKIALQHGGSIEARNRPGKGAEFLLWLPLRQELRRRYIPRKLPASKLIEGVFQTSFREAIVMRRNHLAGRSGGDLGYSGAWVGRRVRAKPEPGSSSGQAAQASRLSRIRSPKRRAAREQQKKDEPKTTKVFTNENIPSDTLPCR